MVIARRTGRCIPEALDLAERSVVVRLVYLAECGFAPSQPVTATWVRKRTRKRVPYENPEGRRVNALAALVKGGADPAVY